MKKIIARHTLFVHRKLPIREQCPFRARPSRSAHLIPSGSSAPSGHAPPAPPISSHPGAVPLQGTPLPPFPTRFHSPISSHQGAAPLQGRAPPGSPANFQAFRPEEAQPAGMCCLRTVKTTPALGARPLRAYVPLRCFPNESESAGSTPLPADSPPPKKLRNQTATIDCSAAGPQTAPDPPSGR